MTFTDLLPIIVPTLAAAVLQGTTILYAALGEVMAERAGILNLGVEGMMLVGAVTAYGVTFTTDNAWLGLAVGAGCGVLMALLHAVVSVTLRSDQIVSGLALTIFGIGFSAFLGKPYVGSPLNDTLQSFPIPLLSDLPYLGQIFFDHDPLVYLSYFLVPLVWYWLYRTKAGLHARAVGENPGAADAAGISVTFYQYFHTLFGGALAGMAGAHLSISVSPSWVEGMVSGRGWIAIALVVFSGWEPIKTMLGAYLFGGAQALVFRLQTVGVAVSPFLLLTLPYVLTVAVLIYASIKKKHHELDPPAHLAQAYERETA